MDYYGFSLGVDVLPGSVFLNVFFTGAIELPFLRHDLYFTQQGGVDSIL